MRRLALALAVLASGLASPALGAQDARALFDAAVKASRDGDSARACKLFKESYAIEPAGGTVLNVAACRETEGDFVGAYNTFAEGWARALHDGKKERADAAKQRLEQLAPKVARVVVNTPDSLAPKRSLWLDSKEQPTLAERPLAVAPGTYLLEVREGAKSVWSTRVTVTRGALAEVPLEAIASSTRSGEPAPSAPSRREATVPSQRTIGLVVGGVGVVGVGVGAVTGALAFGKKTDADAAYAASGSVEATRVADQGRTLADVSTVSFVIGGAALAAGAVLFLTAPSENRTVGIAPAVGGADHANGVLVHGRF